MIESLSPFPPKAKDIGVYEIVAGFLATRWRQSAAKKGSPTISKICHYMTTFLYRYLMNMAQRPLGVFTNCQLHPKCMVPVDANPYVLV